MQQKDLQQMKQLLKEELKENNKEIEKMTDKKINELAIITNQGFAGQSKEINNVKVELKKEISDVKTELRKDISDAKTDLIYSNEKIVTELKDNRQEQAAIIGGRQRMEDTLLNHGDRLDNLEIITKIEQKELAV